VLLMAIGFLDLLSTAILHDRGLIVELNPLMKFFIERSEWLFAIVKGSTLVAAYLAMVWYGRQNRAFVRTVCLVGSAAYLAIWVGWFLSGTYL
jgi:hypothetical protein